MVKKQKEITKKKAIKSFLIIILGMIFLLSIFIFLGFIPYNLKAILLSLAIVLGVMIISAFLGFHYRKSMQKNKRIFYWFMFFLGCALTLISILQIIIKDANFSTFINFIFGFCLILFYVHKFRKK